MTLPPRRPEHLATGARGEELAAAWLAARGYRLLARDLRTRLGELDLVLRRKALLVLVEVKTRTGHEAPERCVARTKIARLERAGRALARVLEWRPRELRIDVVAVRLEPAGGAPEIVHLPGEPLPLA